MPLEELCLRMVLRSCLKRSSNFVYVFFPFLTVLNFPSDSVSEASDSKDQEICGKGAKAIESSADACSNKLFMEKSTCEERLGRVISALDRFLSWVCSASVAGNKVECMVEIGGKGSVVVLPRFRMIIVSF